MEKDCGISAGVSRRWFLGSLVAGAGASAFAGRVKTAPDLTVGILSDIHLSAGKKYGSDVAAKDLIRVFKFFKEAQADAVVIAGDFTNNGTMEEMRVTNDSWKAAFGEKGGPVRVWVTGNHEKVYYWQAKQRGDLTKPEYVDGLYKDIGRNWQELCGEPWSPFFIKKVKGYSFVGAHWGEWFDEKALRGFLAAHKTDLAPTRPFFFVQHAHPTDSCYGPWTWHQSDGGPTTKVLSGYPNAVAFSGHTHYTLTDERSVWQGAFTSVGTGSFRWLAMPAGRENSTLENGEGRRMGGNFGGSQGLLMRVWGDEMVFERYDLEHMEKLGDDWVVPVLHGTSDPRAYSFAARMSRTAAPEFALDAKATLTWRRGQSPAKKEEDQLVVSFPAAVGRGDSASRVYEYEVACQYVEDDTVKPMRTKRAYHPWAQLGEKRAGRTASCVFGAEELPSAPYRIAVTPLNSFGMRGRPLYVKGPSRAGKN